MVVLVSSQDRLVQQDHAYFQNFPKEIFEHILNFVDPKTIQATALTCRKWQNWTTDTASHQQLRLMIFFVDVIKTAEEKFSQDQKNILEKIEETIGIIKNLRFRGLAEIKRSNLQLKKEFLNILIDLTEEDIHYFETTFSNIQFPEFFGNIFKLALIYKKIKVAERIVDEHVKYLTYKTLCTDLCNEKDFDKAIEIVQTISSKEIKFESLRNICISLLESRAIDKAFEIAKTIPKEQYKSDICDRLLELGSVDKAIEIAKTITDKNIKAKVIYKICETLVSIEDIGKAIEITKTMPYKKTDSCYYFTVGALYHICKALCVIGEIDKAFEIANKMPEDPSGSCKDKSAAFFEISKAITRQEDFFKAITLANKLPDWNKAFVLKPICAKLSQEGRFDKAIEIAKTIPIENEKSDALKNICNCLLALGSIDKTIEVAKIIPNKSIKAEIFYHICKNICEQGNFEKAIEIAKKIPIKDGYDRPFPLNHEYYKYSKDSAFDTIVGYLGRQEDIHKSIKIANKLPDVKKSSLQSKICYNLLHHQDLAKAVEIAKTISDKSYKSWSFKYICDELCKKETFDKAIEIAKTIPDKNIKAEVLYNICKALSMIGAIDKAIEIAKKLPDYCSGYCYKYTKRYAFCDIYEQLRAKGDIARANKIAIDHLDRSFLIHATRLPIS